MDINWDDLRIFLAVSRAESITGAGQVASPELSRPVQQIREFTDLPVAVGFGIKNAEMARAVAEHADAVVIGSALVQALADATTKEDACEIATAFVAPVRESLDNMP